MFPDPEAKSKLYGYVQEKSIPAKLSVKLKNHFIHLKRTRTVHKMNTVLLEPQELFLIVLFSLCFSILFHEFILSSSL